MNGDRRSWTPGERLTLIEAELRHLKEGQKDLVTRAEFAPVKLIAFGLIALISAGVIGAVLSTVFAGPAT